ncbi:class I SAM-dependent methyltransferase [Erythrobacter sp. F6033]|uniref:class I SAM-dependent methyltransferase n=1 Tax=Erythrobacter sp. F6033 TaxID=2926401 RepID=UPI001FF5DDA8|nr:class I SAM-dependent methyltransferase [Erythrobacter sp. F6033]MCK0129429.1 class I SAM-dependent methyltransferase [Erythrobacter sp. F6033]
MSNLLIHSMSEFSAIIMPCLKEAEAANITEIGSEFGGMSRELADHCEEQGGMLTCYDPEPDPSFSEWAEGSSAVCHVKQPSLDALETAGPADAWFIDGDHNYFTVFNELVHVDRICCEADRPLLAFLHDVSWPCARRDFYYAPSRVPADWRHPHSYDHGVVLDDDGVLKGRGFRGSGSFAVALKAGGPRNGVLTAVEDFIAKADTEERPLYYVHVPAVFGLGIIFDADAPWAEAIAQFLLPFHQNPLIARLEENRLRNYLEVIDWQDRTATPA